MRTLIAAVIGLAALPAGHVGPALAQTPVLTNPAPLTSTQSTSTITTGGTFQTITAANTSRRGCFIQNNSVNVLYLFLGAGVASTTNSLQVPAGGSFNCANGSGTTVTDLIQGTTSTTGDRYVLLVQ